MAKRILLTSLSAAETMETRFFSAKKAFGYEYCEAVLDTEASIKYLLSHYKLDEIVVVGGAAACDPQDELQAIPLKKGRAYYSADKSALSTYAMLQYRLAQYLDELVAEQEINKDLLSQEEREKLIGFIRKYQEETEELQSKRLDRLFDELSCSWEKYEHFKDAIFAAFPGARELPELYMQWVKYYLYTALKPTAKLELLPVNEDVTVRFIPFDAVQEGGQRINSMMSMNQSIIEGADDIELYIAFNGDDAADSFAVMTLLDIMTAMPNSGVHHKKIFTVSRPYKNINAEIRDASEVFDVSELANGIHAFLSYGKADKIVEFCEKNRQGDRRLSGLIYAIRHVDVGLSMCNIAEVEQGILRLRELYRSSSTWKELNYDQALFSVIGANVANDYGMLLQGDGDIPFIDLVKWAYRHQFYQQTLTLIESKVPDLLVNAGIFYYCNDEAEVGHVTQLLAQQRLQLKPYEYYKMDEISHYFVKYYDRGRVGRGAGSDPQAVYAALRTQSVENKEPNLITGFTACDSLQTLNNLLYAYYHIGVVRNKINHADASALAEFRLNVSENDESAALLLLKDSVEFFIKSYEKAMEELEGKTPHVVFITADEVRRAADRMKNDRLKQAAQTEKA